MVEDHIIVGRMIYIIRLGEEPNGTYLLKLISCRKGSWLHAGSSPAVPTKFYFYEKEKKNKKVFIYY